MNISTQTKSILIDARNVMQEIPNIIAAMQTANLFGLDIETHNDNAHLGIKAMNKGKKLIFDIKRTTLCGLSLWPDGSPVCWYFNIGHADVENRIPWEIVKTILEAKPAQAKWVIHNAAFERTMLGETVSFEMLDYICTLQMAVSAYGPDEYPVDRFYVAGLDAMDQLIPAIRTVCHAQIETSDMQELLQKVIGKASGAAHSYNGYVGNMAYGYGLKKAVKSFFDYEMETYEQVLRGREHMGELTGEEVVSYGCDDAIWCVRLYHRLLQFMLETNPAIVQTFFEQELPMIEIYSESWRHGVKINTAALIEAEAANHSRFADCTRRLKAALKACLPFDAEPNAALCETEEWYRKNGPSYRKKLLAWLNSPDSADDFTQAYQLRGAIPNDWAAKTGVAENKNGLNIGHYMPMRVIMYDLFRAKPIMEQGKVQSDADTRGRLMERLTKQGKPGPVECLKIMGEIATIEQASKLYITPYQKLVDPDTGLIHPQVGSELATRRLSMRDPNAQQLAKRGESVYVRGFYEADEEDHVVVSLDWSQIELVTAGEFSGDEGFLSVYRQLPYRDLHEIAVAGCLQVPLDEFQALKKGTALDNSILLRNPKGEMMVPKQAYKFWRTELGKGANFEFIYSGYMRNVGIKLDWPDERTSEATNLYKATFPVFEEWRLGTIEECRFNSFVTLPDHHRRVRFESTPEWAGSFRSKWAAYDSPAVTWFAEKVIRRIQTRAGNQAVNAKVQGTCATIAKRSALRIRKRFQELGWGKRQARFMFAVHDELVFSVHRDLVTQMIAETSRIMCDHPDIFKSVVLDCSPSVGLTFAPWEKTKARTGQLELREIPNLPFVLPEEVDGPLAPERWADAVNWLFEERQRLAA